MGLLANIGPSYIHTPAGCASLRSQAQPVIVPQSVAPICPISDGEASEESTAQNARKQETDIIKIAVREYFIYNLLQI
jgi:hypothetical protein